MAKLRWRHSEQRLLSEGVRVPQCAQAFLAWRQQVPHGGSLIGRTSAVLSARPSACAKARNNARAEAHYIGARVVVHKTRTERKKTHRSRPDGPRHVRKS